MKAIKFLTSFTVVLVLFLSACDGGQDLPPVEAVEIELTAVLSEVSGEVLARQEGQEDYEVPYDGYVLFQNGVVSTGDSGIVQLIMADGSEFWLGGNTFFTLDPALLGEDLQTNLDLGKGEVVAILNGGSLEINTPAGVAAVQGSIFYVEWFP